MTAYSYLSWDKLLIHHCSVPSKYCFTDSFCGWTVVSPNAWHHQILQILSYIISRLLKKSWALSCVDVQLRGNIAWLPLVSMQIPFSSRESWITATCTHASFLPCAFSSCTIASVEESWELWWFSTRVLRFWWHLIDACNSGIARNVTLITKSYWKCSASGWHN